MTLAAPDIPAMAAAAAGLARLYRERPSRAYRPGRAVDLAGKPIDERDNGQLQFHKAPHVYRLMAPGNGFGKTTTAAVEVDWWGHGDHPWQAVPRDRPRQLLWVAQKFQQFEMQKVKIERWWPASVRNSWNGQHKRYAWPDGSEMYVITAETDWENIQGVEPDMIFIDEECGTKLWHELQRRRRAPNWARYAVTATATKGLTWTYRDLYLPWLKHHAALGLDEPAAMRAQTHAVPGAKVPGIWCWPRGSHADNPEATPESWAEQQAYGAESEGQRQVRLYGGYRSMNGQPVFGEAGLERMRAALAAGRSGSLVLEGKV